MEYHNTNSSLDTLLIFDCDEEKSDEYSSLDSYIMEYEEQVQLKKHNRESDRRRHHKKKGTDSFKTKQVTQEIHVDSHSFKCIINLNTTVCGHSNNGKCNAEPLDKKSKIKRIVPQCMRQMCHLPRNHTRFYKHSKEKCKVDVNSQMKHAKNIKHKTDRCRHGKKISRRTKQKQKLSTSNELELDDISTTSLDSYMDIPISYKHVINPRVQESKLDILIRKAKERERKLTEQSKSTHRYTDTPKHTGMSFEDYSKTCSEIDAYLDSTFIKSKDQGYSPSIKGLCPSPTFERYFRFSNVIQNDFELDIKESTMPIEAYSPTLLNNNVYKININNLNNKNIKKEIKMEPKFD